MTHHLKTIVLALMAAICAACEHKPLIQPNGEYARIRIEFDWQDVNQNEIPEQMTLYFYDNEGNTVVRDVATQLDDHYVILPRSIYTLIAHNREEESTVINPTVPQKHTIKLLEAPDDLVGTIFGKTTVHYLAPTDYPSPLSKTPHRVVAAEITTINLCETTEDTVITIRPRRITAQYDVIIKNLNIDRTATKAWAGAITGMSATLMPQPTLHTDRCVASADAGLTTIPFPINWPETSTTATATFFTFGSPNDQQSHLLKLYIWSDAQSRLSRTYDVTDIIRQAPNPMHVEIIIDFNHEGTGQPFSPDVDSWEDIEETIIA